MYNCSDSYVVRVYRREETDTRQMVGLVETVGNEEHRPFSTLEDLWNILNTVNKPAKTRKTAKKRPHKA